MQSKCTWHNYLWSIGMGDQKAQNVASMVLINHFKAKFVTFSAFSTALTCHWIWQFSLVIIIITKLTALHRAHACGVTSSCSVNVMHLTSFI